MRKFLLMTFASVAIALAAPQAVSAMPIGAGSGINAAADTVSSTQVVHHRRGHHRHWRHRHRHRCY